MVSWDVKVKMKMRREERKEDIVQKYYNVEALQVDELLFRFWPIKILYLCHLFNFLMDFKPSIYVVDSLTESDMMNFLWRVCSRIAPRESSSLTDFVNKKWDYFTRHRPNTSPIFSLGNVQLLLGYFLKCPVKLIELTILQSSLTQN